MAAGAEPGVFGIGWIRSLEWRIAWRHLRAGEVQRWVRFTTWAAIYLLVLGLGFAVYATFALQPTETELAFAEVGLAPATNPLQQQFGVLGGLSLLLGSMLLIFSIFARYFSILATIIIFEVLLGCMALVIVLSLMSGLEGELRDKILAQKAHIRISRADGNRFSDYETLVAAVADTEGIAGASAYLEGEVMIRSGLNRQGAMLIGVDPERLATVSNLPSIIDEGSFESLSDPSAIPEPDPMAFMEDETPFRLRHLEDERKRGGPSGVRPAPVEVEVKDLPPPPGEEPEQGEDAGAAEAGSIRQAVGMPGARRVEVQTDPGSGKLGVPPLPGTTTGRGAEEAFGDDDGGRDDGWEDPMEVLGTDEEADERDPGGEPRPGGSAPNGPATDGASPRGAVPPGPTFGGGSGGDDPFGGDDGWEDPVEELGLELEAEPEPPLDPNSLQEPGAGAGEGSDAGAYADDAIIDPVLIGKELAMELAVHVGSRVQLITPIGRMTPAGRIPGVLATRIGGVFFSGMYEYDRKNVYAPLDVVQAFLRSGDRISGIEVKVDDIHRIEARRTALEGVLEAQGRDDLVVETWEDLNRNLFGAMFLEKIAMFIALLFVILVASFGILASNLMSVLEKSQEIAILKAMGAPDLMIQRVFVAEGLCLGLLGALGGISFGLVLAWALDTYGFPMNENLYYIEKLPIVVNPGEVLAVGISVMVIVWASSLYPAWIASRMRPVDALRHLDQ